MHTDGLTRINHFINRGLYSGSGEKWSTVKFYPLTESENRENHRELKGMIFMGKNGEIWVGFGLNSCPIFVQSRHLSYVKTFF